MKKLMIPLLLSIALLSGCQRVTVRHSVPLPVEVAEHRHVHQGVVVVHHHEGGHHRSHHHSHPDPRTAGRVVVVTPPPVVSRHEVTIQHEQPSHHHRGHSHRPHGRDDEPHHRARRPAPQPANRLPVAEVVKSWGKGKRTAISEDKGVSVWDRVDGREKRRVVVTPPVVNRHEVTIKREPHYPHRQNTHERHVKRDDHSAQGDRHPERHNSRPPVVDEHPVVAAKPDMRNSRHKHDHTPRSHNDRKGEKPSQRNSGYGHTPQGGDDKPHHRAGRPAPQATNHKPVAEVVRSRGKDDRQAAAAEGDGVSVWKRLDESEKGRGPRH